MADYSNMAGVIKDLDGNPVIKEEAFMGLQIITSTLTNQIFDVVRYVRLIDSRNRFQVHNLSDKCRLAFR